MKFSVVETNRDGPTSTEPSPARVAREADSDAFRSFVNARAHWLLAPRAIADSHCLGLWGKRVPPTVDCEALRGEIPMSRYRAVALQALSTHTNHSETVLMSGAATGAEQPRAATGADASFGWKIDGSALTDRLPFTGLRVEVEELSVLVRAWVWTAFLHATLQQSFFHVLLALQGARTLRACISTPAPLFPPIKRLAPFGRIGDINNLVQLQAPENSCRLVRMSRRSNAPEL
jgi:hypothetical protein